MDTTKPNSQLKVYRFLIPASVKALGEGSLVPPLTMDRASPGKSGVTGTTKAKKRERVLAFSASISDIQDDGGSPMKARQLNPGKAPE